MDDLEMRLEDVENRLASIDGAEPTTYPTGSKPLTLADAHREIQLIWGDLRGVLEDIKAIKIKLGM